MCNNDLNPIGTIIYSTTCNTMAKVVAAYGGKTWIQHSGYVLRGATSGVTANSATKTGGNDTHTLTVDEMPSHNHGGATGAMSANSTHSHTPWGGGEFACPNNSHNVTNLGFGLNTGFQPSFIANTNTVDINHTHSISAQGGGQAFSVLENYKSVYIWERVA